MNNTLKVLDDAIKITLEKHPEELFRSSVALGLSRKIQGGTPESYAKTFTSTNFARQKVLELKAENVKDEVIKNAIKLVCLLARKKYKIALNQKKLESGNYVVGEVACGRVMYGIQHGKTINELIKEDENLLNALCKNFIYTRYIPNKYFVKEELDAKENTKYCEKYFDMMKSPNR